jgi:hypothetical protein
MTLSVGSFHASIATRPWAAILVLSGAALWIVGVTFLVLLPQR